MSLASHLGLKAEQNTNNKLAHSPQSMINSEEKPRKAHSRSGRMHCMSQRVLYPPGGQATRMFGQESTNLLTFLH